MSDSVRPHRWQPARLHHPWDSPGKNTGVSCHLLLQCMKVKSESEVAQSCSTPSDSMDCSPPGSSVHGIFQARVLEWGAIAFSDIQSWCGLKAWISSFPGMLRMMSSWQLPRKKSSFALLARAMLLTTAGSLALSIFQLLVAAGYWVDGLTTENLMKSTEKNHTVEVMLSSHDFHA